MFDNFRKLMRSIKRPIKMTEDYMFICNVKDVENYSFGKPYKIENLCRYLDVIYAFVKNDKLTKEWVPNKYFRERR